MSPESKEPSEIRERGMLSPGERLSGFPLAASPAWIWDVFLPSFVLNDRPTPNSGPGTFPDFDLDHAPNCNPGPHSVSN
ncbi:hypothetical protein EVAR_29205_1 [Eumeta japonica]|uniref:Uncharacterized protein n=1 Tax=Eumeta variegata TaxID=151549 RepID=A0A4C1VIN8_EUMVA|nr:hypothetical protein EVAR_29205_1 [Eumeta japonica]